MLHLNLKVYVRNVKKARQTVALHHIISVSGLSEVKFWFWKISPPISL